MSNKKTKRHSISFVLPMYNESENVESTIKTLRALAASIAGDHEIVIVDDASTDNSAELVEKISKVSDDIRFYRLRENTRFGGAFARGFKSASKDVIMYMDFDMPVSAADIIESYALIEDYDIVTGCSKVNKGDTLKRKVMSGVYNFLVQSIFGLNIKDINSGYKIVKRSIVEDLDFVSRSPFADVELFIHAKKKGVRVKQFPLVFQSRTGGKSYISSLPIIKATFRDMIKIRFLKQVR